VNAARKLLDDLALIGATIEPVGDRLILRAGSTAIPADLVIRIRQTKAELLDALPASSADRDWTGEDWEAYCDGRAGFLEFDGGLPRTTAEAQAFEACVVEWLNRNPAPSPAGRCTWCGDRETDSARVLPFGTEPGTHAWLHSECWLPWCKHRQKEAASALRRMGIRPPSPPVNPIWGP
jgi:hypothetical protein